MEQKNEVLDREYWNIVKGIGIFCVILGHTCFPAQFYVYLFHLPLFFFVSGYFYREKKYGDDPFLNVTNKLRTSWRTYVLVYLAVIALHNVFYAMGLLRLSDRPYTREETLVKMSAAVFGEAYEVLFGPMWFIPVLVEAVILLGFIVSVSRFLRRITGRDIWKFLFQGVCVVVPAVAAYPLIAQKVHLASNLQFAFAALPYLWAGYLLRNYASEIKRYLYVLPALICAVLLFFLSRNTWIDWILGLVKPGMYAYAFLGIYLCLVCAVCLQRISALRKFVSCMGRHSMFLMISHQAILRIVDRIISSAVHDTTRELYDVLPVAFRQLWPLYLPIGIFVPLALAVCCEKLYFFVSAKCGKIKDK